MRGDTYHRHLERKVDGKELWHRHELGGVTHDHDDLPNYYPSNGADEMYVTMYWWSWVFMALAAICIVVGGWWLMLTVIKVADWIGWLS